MKKTLKISLIVVGALIVLLVALLVAANIALNSNSVQNKILHYATEQLAQKLETRVEIDSVSVNIPHMAIDLHGMAIDDREQRPMLQIEQLSVKMNLRKLLSHNVTVESAYLKGAKAAIYVDSAGVGNYQFLIDAFKKDSVDTDTTSQGFDFALNAATLEDIELTFNDSFASFSRLEYTDDNGRHEATLNGLNGKFVAHTKKGDVDHSGSCETIHYQEQDTVSLLDITNLRYISNNHKPRKNHGKPNRGFFDKDHFDVIATMQLAVHYADKDSANVTLKSFKADDEVAGLHVTSVTCDAAINKRAVRLSNVDIKHAGATHLHFANGIINLPNKAAGVPLTYSTSTITGSTMLRDISRAFSPALVKFSLPLTLSTRVSGTATTLAFKDVRVSTADKRLTIAAVGNITNLPVKEKMVVHFDVSKMAAGSAVIHDIINQFPLKHKFMMKQLNALGQITYTGGFSVIYKHEKFQGTLGTAVGSLNFNVDLNHLDNYLYGKLKTNRLDLGRILDTKDFKQVACDIDCKFDFSKDRTAAIRKNKGGKLPIGTVNAFLPYCQYREGTIPNVTANIESDGVVATGNIRQQNKLLDLLCSFSLTDLDDYHSIKIRPGVNIDKGKAEVKSVFKKIFGKKKKSSDKE